MLRTERHESNSMISVIIPSYNSEQTIERCLDSVLKQSYAGNYEIILVDSSDDATPRIVNSSYPQVSFFHFEKKTDPGTARNLGISKARGELLAFLDSDCIAAPDWLASIAQAHRSEYAAVGGCVLNGNDERSIVAWAGYIAEFREFIPEQARREVSHIPTCNISYKKKVFDTFGMFDGKCYPQEDLVFNHTLWKSGEKILFDPSIRVYHTHRTHLPDFLRHQRRIGEITARVMRKLGLQGAFIARSRLAAFVFMPGMPFIKFLRTIAVFLRLQPATVLVRPQVLPVFAVGLCYWLAGFMQSVWKADAE